MAEIRGRRQARRLSRSLEQMVLGADGAGGTIEQVAELGGAGREQMVL